MSSDRIHLNRPDPFGLAELETPAPPADRWPAVAATLAGRRRRRKPAWLWPAAAALLVASLGLIVLLSDELDEQQREIDQWIAYSQILETELSQLRQSNSVLRGHEALAVSELEDLVAMVDNRLAQPTDDGQLALWQQRAAIMNDLVTVQALANERRWQPQAAPAPVLTRNLSARPALQPAAYQQ